MLQVVLAIIVSVIFFILALIHFNWAIGGTWGLAYALPTNKEGKKVLNPKMLDSLLVGFGLLAFAIFFIIKVQLIKIELPDWILNYLGWLIALIFLLRALGDFKYIGFFKKVKKTTFAKADSRYFSPLCLVLGILIILIQVL